MSGDVIVQIGLDDLCSLKNSADVSQIYRKERDDVQHQLDLANEQRNALQEKVDMWTEAEKATNPEANAYAFLAAHDTPFEDKGAEEACAIIRALLIQANAKATEGNE